MWLSDIWKQDEKFHDYIFLIYNRVDEIYWELHSEP